MKKLLLYMACIILTISSCYRSKHENTFDNQGENMLIEFYSKHFDIWKNNQDSWKNIGPNTKVSVTTRKEKLDSLMKIYCTSKVRNEAIKVYENAGVDYMTQNFLGNINENLKAKKVSGKENTYIVTFTSTILEIPTKPLKQNVTLYVTLIKSDESFKISSVR